MDGGVGGRRSSGGRRANAVNARTENKTRRPALRIGGDGVRDRRAGGTAVSSLRQWRRRGGGVTGGGGGGGSGPAAQWRRREIAKKRGRTVRRPRVCYIDLFCACPATFSLAPRASASVSAWGVGCGLSLRRRRRRRREVVYESRGDTQKRKIPLKYTRTLCCTRTRARSHHDV